MRSVNLPFAVLYLFDQERETVELAGISGISRGHQAIPETVMLGSSPFWPFAEALREQKYCLVDGIDQMFDNLPTGAWNRPPRQAIAVPIVATGQIGKAGVLLASLMDSHSYRR